MKRRLSIALVNNFPGPSLGGGEVQLLELIEGLVCDGHSVTLVCRERSALCEVAPRDERVRVVPVDFTRSSPAALVKSILPHLEGVDVVQGTGYYTNILSRRIHMVTGIPVVNVVHVVPGASQLVGEKWRAVLARRFVDMTTRGQVGKFVAVSQAVIDGLVEEGVDLDRIIVIPNGFDVQALRAGAREQLQIALPPKPLVGYMGRLELVKGCEYFIRAAAIIADRRGDVNFVVAGTGSLLEPLKKLAVDLGVGSRILFADYVTQAPALLSALDVAVVPSISEASGFTAAEALVLGVPLVATDVGGIPEVVAHEETGLLVPPRDAQAIAGAVLRLIDDPELSARLSSQAAQLAEKAFSRDQMVASYVDVYRTLIGL